MIIHSVMVSYVRMTEIGSISKSRQEGVISSDPSRLRPIENVPAARPVEAWAGSSVGG